MGETMRNRKVLSACVIAVALAVMAPAAQAATVTVAAAGDIARKDAPGTPQTQTADLITNRINPSKVFVLGDEQYEAGEFSQFQVSYDPTWGAFKAMSAPVPGNHEYLTPGAAGYFQYFDSELSGYGASAIDPSRGYYSFDVGDWHIAALNSNCSVVDCLVERTWLKQDLASDDHLCELAFYHHSNNKGFAKRMALSGGELVLAGHVHTYERFDNVFGLAIRQIVAGTGGHSVRLPDPAADAGVKAYGVLKLKLEASKYSWSFIDVNGNVRDSGSDTCHS